MGYFSARTSLRSVCFPSKLFKGIEKLINLPSVHPTNGTTFHLVENNQFAIFDYIIKIISIEKLDDN